MGLGTGATAAIIGGIGAAGSVASAAIGANAAGNAASQQVAESDKALQFQEQVYGNQQQNLAPYLAAGSTNLATLMKDFQNGTFGPGSIPAFTAPTAAEAAAMPGYQFNLQQGLKAIDEGAAARGGLDTGGTIKAEQGYGAGLASSTYEQTFQNALQQYQAALTGQAQAYNELAGPIQTGLAAATGVNQAGTAAATNVAGLMTGIGNAQAAGTIGTANAVAGGVSGATGNLTNAWLLQQFLNASKGTGAPSYIDPGTGFNAQGVDFNMPGTPGYTAPIAPPDLGGAG